MLTVSQANGTLGSLANSPEPVMVAENVSVSLSVPGELAGPVSPGSHRSCDFLVSRGTSTR